MKIQDNLKTATIGLRTQKSRSALTVLGIVIGVMAIIMVMAIGQGAEELILNQVRGIGSRTIIIEPGREPKGPSDIYELFLESLKERDVDALKKQSNVRGNNRVAPMIGFSGTAAYKNETKRTNIVGSSDLWMKILDIYPEEGVMFTDEEIKQRANVAVIGKNVKKELFGSSEALGQKFKIKNRSFRIIGILPSIGQIMMMDADDIIVVPYTTVQKYLLGVNHYHAILIQAESEKMVPYIVKDIELTLRELHNITDPDKDDFHITTMQDMVKRVSIITSVLTVLLVSVAAISLLVGGIGIMNIMLVSVSERTKEIGLRKAIGATKGDIMTQFLFESTILTITGGIIGILLGAGFSWLTVAGLKKFANVDWVFVFPILAVFLGIGVATTVGLIFGLYPASQAAKKSPTEAMRYE